MFASKAHASVLSLFLLLSILLSKAQAQNDYLAKLNVTGTLTAAGSDSIARIMTEWEREFRKFNPGVNIQLQAAGSSTAAIALIQGTTDIGMMSRKMKLTESKLFRKAFGYDVLELVVALDAEIVIVNLENPLNQIAISELDMIFSSTFKCGGNREIKHWSDISIGDDFANLAKKSIRLFGRNSTSGTYVYFKQQALCNGDFKASVIELPGAAAVVDAVADSISSVGFAALGYKKATVKSLAVSEKKDRAYFASAENIRSGAYPLSRKLYFYINKSNNKALSPHLQEFLSFIFSTQGQSLLEKYGFVSISEKLIKSQLALIAR